MREITQTEFDDVLADAQSLVVVDFFADWCGPCKALGPILAQVEQKYGGEAGVEFIKINTDTNRELSGMFGVKSLPTVLILQPREEAGADVVGYAIGVKPAQHYGKLLDKALGKSTGALGWLKRKLGGADS